MSATGEETLVTAALGRPYQAQSGEWRCPVWLTPLHHRLPDIAGEYSLQALCLAASLIRTLLENVVEQGGRVLDPSSRSEYAIAAVFGRVGAPPGELPTR